MITTGRWLFLAGLLLMVTGDGPAATIRESRWPTPLPFLAWPWLYLVLLSLGMAGLAAGGALRSWRADHLRFLATPLALLLAACLLSTIASEAPSLSVPAFLAVLGIVGACWLFAVALADQRLTGWMFPTTAIALFLLAFRVVAWRRDEGLDVVAYQVANNAWLGKLQLAWVFNLFAPFLLARSLGESRRAIAVLYGLAWAATAVATYVLFSRMGSIVFAATTLGVVILNLAHWRRALLILLLAAALAGGLAARSGQMSRFVVGTLFEPERNPGIAIRLGVWRDALRLFRAHPIAGTGIGTFDEVAYSLEGTTADSVYRLGGWHAHNVYLHVLAEMGVVGLTAWCYFWYAIAGRLLHAWRRADPSRRMDAAAALLAVVAFLVLSTTEVLIGARVHAGLRMNLTIGFVVVFGLHLALRSTGARAGGPVQSREPSA